MYVFRWGKDLSVKPIIAVSFMTISLLPCLLPLVFLYCVIEQREVKLSGLLSWDLVIVLLCRWFLN